MTGLGCAHSKFVEIKMISFEIKSGNFNIKKCFEKIKIEMFKPKIKSGKKTIIFFSFDTPRTPYESSSVTTAISESTCGKSQVFEQHRTEIVRGFRRAI